MQEFDFSGLIDQYSSEFKVITYVEGEIDDRGYISGGTKKEITLNGAIISRGENTVFRSDGTLTAKDKRLFMLTPIDKALLNSKIVYENEVYDIQSSTDNSKFTGVWAYILKFVSAFNDEKDGDG